MPYRSSFAFLAPLLALAACSGARDADLFPTGDRPTRDAGPDAPAPPRDDAEAPLPDAAPGAPSCEASPLDDARVASEACGVFVAPARLGGADDAPGTRARPVATLRAAVSAARAGGRRWVLACAADYDESLALDARSAGVAIFGGLVCPGDAGAAAFTVRASAHAALRPSAASGAALTVSGIGLPLAIHAFDVIAPAATTGSSVAMWVTDCARIELRDVMLRAGRGAAGVAGADGIDGEPEGAAPGRAATDADGARAEWRVCVTGGQTRGGRGGASDPKGFADATSGAEGDLGGAGGTAAACRSAHRGGEDGKPGRSGAPGAGAAGPGSFDDRGWRSEPGTDGQAGAPGGGGGGGGAGDYRDELPPFGTFEGGGGAGGAGTCGGGGGRGGQGGGASIALAVRRSGVSVVASRIEASAAGAGGDGGRGRVAVLGAAGGWYGTDGSGNGCPGGRGGAGGTGGGGGGGAGGTSAAIVTDGSEVVVDAVSALSPGAAGRGGRGGSGAGDGSPGAAVSILRTHE